MNLAAGKKRDVQQRRTALSYLVLWRKGINDGRKNQAIEFVDVQQNLRALFSVGSGAMHLGVRHKKIGTRTFISIKGRTIQVVYLVDMK